MFKSFLILTLFFTHSYIFAQTQFNVRLINPDKILTSEKLNNFLPVEQFIVKLELLANRGKIFGDTNISKHFRKQIWYNPKENNIILTQTDSINLNLLQNILNDKALNISHNISKVIKDTSEKFRVYYTRIKENLEKLPAINNSFTLFPFSFCKTMQIFKPTFLNDIPPMEFEYFLDSTKFNIDEYKNFSLNNGVVGDLFRVLYKSDLKPFLIEELGIIPEFNLGKVFGRYYLNEAGNVVVTHSKICIEKNINEMAEFYFYNEINELIKTLLIITTDTHTFVRISSNEFFMEIGIPRDYNE